MIIRTFALLNNAELERQGSWSRQPGRFGAADAVGESAILQSVKTRLILYVLD